MNRLIIIGNGFDLAHNLETSVKHFIIDHLKNITEEAISKGTSKSSLLSISVDPENRYNLNYFDTYLNKNPLTTYFNIKNSGRFKITFYSNLFSDAIEFIDNAKWVDLEVEYFNGLLDNIKGIENEFNKEAILKLVKDYNEEFQLLKDEFLEYLSNHIKTQKPSYSYNLLKSFIEPIRKDDIVTVNLKDTQRPESLYFLNFNYTKTVEQYLKDCKEYIEFCPINYIHGDLSGENGNPIFGYGDEIDKRYKEFEHYKLNELFHHIKSFEYHKSTNYHELMRFIGNKDFQVHIYGHSCGISDRTMLNEVFEHDHCKSIKIFYHKDNDKNDFTEKTYEIYRHFNNKGMARKKIVPFPLCRPMPQPKDE